MQERFAREREALGLKSVVNDADVNNGTDGLGDEVERASGEVVGQIRGAGASAKGPSKRPARVPIPLETRIYHATRAIEAKTARLISPQSDNPQDTTATERPDRRYTTGEKQAWREERALKRLPLASSDAVGEEVAKLEEAVKPKMEGGIKEVTIRLGVAMGRLRSAREKYERAKAGSAEREERKGEEKAREDGVLGKIRGLIRRR